MGFECAMISTVMTRIDESDAKLLDILQGDFPVTSRPFDVIAERLACSPAEVISRISRLTNTGVIRQISAIFDSAALGYQSALVALRVDDVCLDAVAERIAAHRGVSHCYSRDSDYNLWFTITVGPGADLDGEVGSLITLDGVRSAMVLPALRVYKIGVFLRMGEAASHDNAARVCRASAHAIELDSDDIEAVKVLQRDLPLVETPFAELASAAGMSEDDLLDRAERFLEMGVMRRFGAVLRHGEAGYRSNAMVCWRVERKNLDEIGRKMAENPAVSHCYERPSYPDWPYTLYTMIHCRTDAQLRQTIESLAHLCAISEYVVLKTVREYKKSRVSYFD